MTRPARRNGDWPHQAGATTNRRGAAGSGLLLLLLTALAAACTGAEHPLAVPAAPDSVVTNPAAGEWHLAVDGREVCTALNAPPAWGQSDFLAMCRMLTQIDT
jgi:hypothetical protein